MTIKKLFPVALKTHDEGAAQTAADGVTEEVAEVAESEAVPKPEPEQPKALPEDESPKDEQAMLEQAAARLREEAEQMQSIYPGFDLLQELEGNPEFRSLLKAGTGVEGAYWAVHFRELGAGLAAAAGRRAEENFRNKLNAKGKRPLEAGAAVQPGVIVRDDPSKFTKSELRTAVEKARHGERIKF